MNYTEILLYVVLPLITVGYLFLKKKFSYFEDRGIPHIKPSWLMGNMKGVGQTVHIIDLVQKVYENAKEKDVITGFYTAIVPTLVVTDLELIKQITVKEFNNFTDRGVFVNEEDEPLTGHLFALGGEKWRFLRNRLSPVFTSGKIKNMYHTISDKGDNLIKSIELASKSGSVDMKNISNRFTVDVVSSCAFGIEANTLNNEHPEVMQILKQTSGEESPPILYGLLLFYFPKLPKFLKLRQFKKPLSQFFFDVIGGNITNREENKIVRNDFLNMLVQLKNRGYIEGEASTESRMLNLNECVAQGFGFFLSGSDTTSTVISYAVAELGRHPEIQDRLRKEIIDVSAAENGKLTYDNIQEMSYLNQVVNEALRKFPPAPVTVRTGSNDYKIPGSKHTIEKNVQVMIPNICIHYDERYWKEPEKFDPERFTAEEISRRPSLAFMPFGEGPRNCIGMRFALINVKFGITTIIKNFKVELDTTKTPLPLTFDPKNPNLGPVGGFWMKFNRL